MTFIIQYDSPIPVPVITSSIIRGKLGHTVPSMDKLINFRYCIYLPLKHKLYKIKKLGKKYGNSNFLSNLRFKSKTR